MKKRFVNMAFYKYDEADEAYTYLYLWEKYFIRFLKFRFPNLHIISKSEEIRSPQNEMGKIINWCRIVRLDIELNCQKNDFNYEVYSEKFDCFEDNCHEQKLLE